MPIKIGDRTFEKFSQAVSHIKRTRPDVSNPEAFVAAIERKQRGNPGKPQGRKKLTQSFKRS